MSEKKGYADVNGLKMYYERHGSGPPLILLHGGAGSTEMFGGLTPSLSEDREVILLDLQAHGRTADIDRPLRYEFMADDTAALMDFLGLARADFMGYSLGGGVALRTAIQYPAKVARLILVSTPSKRQGWYPEVLLAMSQGGNPESAEAMKKSPMYQVYSRVAPRVEDWPVMFAKLAEMLRREYDWSDEVARITAPTMLIIGDADSVRTAHAVEFFGLLGGGKEDGGWDSSRMPKARLSILPGTTHYNIVSSEQLKPTVRAFLGSQSTKTAAPDSDKTIKET